MLQSLEWQRLGHDLSDQTTTKQKGRRALDWGSQGRQPSQALGSKSKNLCPKDLEKPLVCPQERPNQTDVSEDPVWRLREKEVGRAETSGIGSVWSLLRSRDRIGWFGLGCCSQDGPEGGGFQTGKGVGDGWEVDS